MNELINQKNLAAIQKSWFEDRNQPYFDDISSQRLFRECFDRWSDFFATHPTTTKQELEEFSKELVADYSKMFSSTARRTFS